MRTLFRRRKADGFPFNGIFVNVLLALKINGKKCSRTSRTKKPNVIVRQCFTYDHLFRRVCVPRFRTGVGSVIPARGRYYLVDKRRMVSLIFNCMTTWRLIMDHSIADEWGIVLRRVSMSLKWIIYLRNER